MLGLLLEILEYGMVWYGMVWYGMVWYGMVWYGKVWYGMLRCGMTCKNGLWFYIVKNTQVVPTTTHFTTKH